MFVGHEQLVGPQAALPQPGLDEPPADRLVDLRLDDPRVDLLVDLFLEVADLLGALVLDADEADPHRRRAGSLEAAGWAPWQCRSSRLATAVSISGR